MVVLYCRVSHSLDRVDLQVQSIIIDTFSIMERCLFLLCSMAEFDVIYIATLTLLDVECTTDSRCCVQKYCIQSFLFDNLLTDSFVIDTNTFTRIMI